MNENLEKVKLADRKRQEIARRIKARLDRQRRQELERIRMMNAFAIVSKLIYFKPLDEKPQEDDNEQQAENAAVDNSTKDIK